jgi:hypothetical protein
LHALEHESLCSSLNMLPVEGHSTSFPIYQVLLLDSDDLPPVKFIQILFVLCPSLTVLHKIEFLFLMFIILICFSLLECMLQKVVRSLSQFWVPKTMSGIQKRLVE